MTNTTLPKITKLISHKDKRGEFIELLKRVNLTKTQFGQLSVTSVHANQQKGNHYHKTRWEWFYVIEGKVDVELIHVKTKKKKLFHISSLIPQMICIPPYWNHVLLNKSNKAATAVVYSSIVFDKKNPDVYVLGE